MFCIWADYPGAETEESVITKTAATIAAFGATLPKDGIVISDAANNDGQLETGGTMVLTANKQVDWTTSDASVASIAPSDPEAVMAAAETGAVNATAITVTAKKAGSATITATAGNKSATYAVTVNDPGKKNVTVTVGQTVTLDPVEGEATIESDYDSTVAEVTVKTETSQDHDEYPQATFDENAEESTFTYLSVGNSVTDKPSEVTLTIENVNGAYYLKNAQGYYVYPNYNSTDGYVLTNSYSTGRNGIPTVNIDKNDTDGSIAIYRYFRIGRYNYPTYLTLSSSGLSATGSPTNIFLYTKETIPASKTTTISVKGIKEGGSTTVQIGGVTYNINVVKEDLAKVTPLTIEYWITNSKVYKESDQNSESSVEISAAEANSEDGIAVASRAPSQGHSFFDGDVLVYYWQTMRLTDNNRQIAKDGNDGTSKGETLTHVRYMNSKWQYKTLDGEWKDFQSNDQVVAYYLQKTDVTKEITTYGKDWGYSTNTTTPNTSGGKGQVALTVAVVYPDGTVSPAEDKLYANSTTIFNYWADRDIGIVSPTNNSDYTISKITVTDGQRNGNENAVVWYTTDTITWDKKANETGEEWYDETTVWDETEKRRYDSNGKRQEQQHYLVC